MNIIFETSTGRILSVIDSSSDPTLPDGFDHILMPDGYTSSQILSGIYRIVAGTVGDRVPTLAENKKQKTIAAVGILDGLILAGFTFSGVLYQIDQSSQSNIAAMSVTALASIADPAAAPWPSDFYWIASDNSHVAMNAPKMLEFGHAVGSYISSCILQLRAIKDAIAAAADQAALDAIDLTAGYPNANT